MTTWIACLVLLYAGAWMALDGAMLALAPGWSVALAALLIWLSVEDMARLSFPIWGLAVLMALAFAISGASQIALLSGLGWAAAAAVARWAMGSTRLGAGDVAIVGAAGVLLGPIGPLSVVLGASVTALAWVAATAATCGAPVTAPRPFGPFLAFFIWVIFLEPFLLL